MENLPTPNQGSYLSLFAKIAALLLLVISVITLAAYFELPSFYILIAAAFLLFFSAAASYLLLKPIHHLSQQIKQFTQTGQLTNPISIKTGDEIEQLAEAFNKIVSGYAQASVNNVQTQQNLSVEENKLNIILSGIADGIIVVDKNRNITTFNTGAVELTGVSYADALNKPVNQIFTLFEKGAELPLNQFCPTESDGSQKIILEKEELRLVSTVKKEAYVNLTAGHIHQSNESDIGCIIALHDVTKEKQLKDMQLDFVSMAAHELRTPLTSLRGYLSVMTQENDANLKQNKPHLTADQVMFLDKIDASSKQLLALVENLLNVSRIERGVFTIKLEPINWTETVEQAVLDQQTRATSKTLNLQFIPPTVEIPNIQADKLRINEVLANLIANAINYTNPNGQIQVSIEKNAQEVITHIKDTGIGIKKEAIPHLFNKFFRAQESLTQGTKGTGLGLYISKSIVDLHKGKIWVESEEGKGSTFSFSLPLV